MKLRKKRGTFDQDNLDRWLLTYADLITLLLGFFVIMYSMSRIDAKRFGQMTQNLQGVFHGNTEEEGDSAQNLESGVLKVGRLKIIQQRIKNLALAEDSTSSSLSEQVTAELNERGLIIHILESTLFDLGKAELKPEARKTLDLIASEIKSLPNQVRVEGHTDNLPISTFRYPSNWELSTARATTVVRYFVEEHALSPARVSALGFGEFRPLYPNDADSNRARNRRVDVVVLTDELSEMEPSASVTDTSLVRRSL